MYLLLPSALPLRVPCAVLPASSSEELSPLSLALLLLLLMLLLGCAAENARCRCLELIVIFKRGGYCRVNPSC